MKKTFLIILIFLCMAQEVHAKLFNAKEFMLDNGLRVVVIENNKAPIIEHRLVYKVGAIDESEQKAGLAHLLEHLMFKKTKKISNFNQLMQHHGVEFNAATGYDFTAYYAFADISKLEMIMLLEADRMKNLAFDEKDLENEKNVVLQERKQVVENSPDYLFDESFDKILWQNHPYAKPITGTEDTINNISKEDVYDFYERYYNPKNAVLVLAGNITEDKANVLAQKYYGKIKNNGQKNNNQFENVTPVTAELNMKLKNIYQPKLLFKSAIKTEDIYPFILLSQFLGGGETSYLYKNLVSKHKKAVSINAYFDAFARGTKQFVLTAVPVNGVEYNELKEEIIREISKAMKSLSQEQLEKEKKKAVAGLIYLSDNPQDAAQITGYLASTGFSLEQIENYAEEIKKVTLQQLKDASEKLLTGSANVWGFLQGENNE